MASATTEPRIGRVDDDEEEEDDLVDNCDGGDHGVMAREVREGVSRLAVEGGDADSKVGRDQGVYKIGGGGGNVFRSAKLEGADAVQGRRSAGGGRTLPPPHAWLAIEDTKKHYDSEPEAEQWMRLLRGGCRAGAGRQQRRSSFSVVRRESAAREAWLDRAWEMKRSWHERNGGMAMDVEEVRACRDLGLELPSDCTVEIQCYGFSGTHIASSGADSPCSISSPGADPTDVKAQLKVWAQAVALASTTHLGS